MTSTPDTSKSNNLKPDLTGFTLEELEDFFSGLGKEKYRGAQVMKWIHQHGVDSFDRMTNLAKGFRDELNDKASVYVPEIVDEAVSEDGTKKLLLRLRDGLTVETVLIPSADHDTICVSTQVGCAMGCRICRTASMGLVRNLSAGEIVSQLLAMRRHYPESKITNMVFMGMGEPLANFDNCAKAVKILTHPNGPGISWRRLTISTSGLIPGIKRMGEEIRAKLAVSLNGVTDEQRDLIMPINRKYPIAALIDELKRFPLPRRGRITIEYVLIQGLNDSDSDAKALVKLLNPIRAKVNLIALNENVARDLKAPDYARVLRFQEILMSKSLMTIIRKSMGRDILAACGQLAGREKNGRQ